MKLVDRLMGYWRRRDMKRHQGFGKDATGVRLLLCDRNTEIVETWCWVFRDVEAVEIWEGDLLQLDADALVSPANSFGDMSGGIDKAIDDFYRGAAQDATMKAIRDRFYGELPVGMAMVLPMETRRFPFLIVAPTMRIPGSVAGTINAYLALRAVLVTVLQYNKQNHARPIETIAVPGLGTGVGGMDYGAAAEQMRAAFDSILGGGWEKVVHPAMAPFAASGKHFRFEPPDK